MRTVGSYELKTHLAEVLDAVEHGQTVIVTRHGKPIARLTPNGEEKRPQVKQAVEALQQFPRTRLPKGITIRSLIPERRRRE
jgi:prevent-host-death family protein